MESPSIESLLVEPSSGWLAVGWAGTALVIGSVLAWILSFIFVIGSRTRGSAVAKALFKVGSLFAIAALAALISLLVGRQYEFAYVFQNTDNSLSLPYRIGAAWAAQEGSFTLWLASSALMCLLFMPRNASLLPRYIAIAAIPLAACAAILAYESPFRLIEIADDLKPYLAPGQTMVVPPDGAGLNPVLVNYWMIIHPWVIFLGFGSLLPLFALSGASAIAGDFSTWLAQGRKVAFVALFFLGVGLVMGGLWAYETLGWGGFWAWDPVENTSLVPFLAVGALVHGLYLQHWRGHWKRANLVLAGLPFALFAYGTFLTRSGQLANVSVHSFAQMDPVAHKLLLGFVLGAIVAVVVVHGVVGGLRRPEGERSPASEPRSRAITIGVVSLWVLSGLAAIGMSVPFLAAQFSGVRKTVDEGDYNQMTWLPLLVALALMAIAPQAGWKEGGRKFSGTLIGCVLFAVVITGCILAYLAWGGLLQATFSVQPLSATLVVLLSAATLFAMSANAVRGWSRMKAHAGRLGGYVAHMGISILLLGLLISRGFETKDRGLLYPTKEARIELASGEYTVRMTENPSIEQLMTPESTLALEIHTPKGSAMPFRPVAYYHMPLGREEDIMPVTRPSVRTSGLSDLYVSATAPDDEVVRGVEVRPGESVERNEIRVEHLGALQDGDPGRQSVRLRITADGQTFDLAPAKLHNSDGFSFEDERMGEDMYVRLDGVKPDGAAVVSVNTIEPYVVVEIYEKPLARLVWVGAILLAVGVGLAFVSAKPKSGPVD